MPSNKILEKEEDYIGGSDESPVTSPSETPTPQEVADTPVVDNTQLAAPATPAPMAAATAVPSAVATPPVQAPVAAQPQTAMAIAPISAQGLRDEDQKTAQDLVNGQINPKTYSDLFAKKDTLGKIGTIFGLLVSGAGAGLSHQPNALLEMMNKEIQNDLEAQKHSASNAQNLLRLNQQNEANKAEIDYKQKQGLLTAQQAKALKMDTDMKGFAYSNMQANRLKLHALVERVNKLPVNSPERAEAERMLALVSNQVEAENYDIADRAAAASAMTHAKFFNDENQVPLTNPPQSSTGKPQQGKDTGININKMNDLIFRAKQNPDLPGVITPTDIGAVTEESKRVQSNRALYDAWVDSFNKLNQAFGAGHLNPEKRKAVVTALTNRLSHDLNLSTEQAKDFAEASFPTIKDFGSSRGEKFYKGTEHFKGLEANTPTLDRFGIKTAFPKYSIEKPKEKKSSSVVAKNRPPEERTIEKEGRRKGQVALFDPETKKFLRFKDEANNIAGQ